MSVENLSGQIFGKYQLRELLGAGGMGAVYRAYHAELRRDVAFKVLSSTFASHPDSVDRFLREAQTAAALEHRHIVPVYDFGSDNNVTFVVMRLLTGGSLAQRIEQQAQTGQPLPSLVEISGILNELASALDYAHSQGVVHRDIKASNVMFNNQGEAFLVDFGIVKLLDATNSLTNENMQMGTPSYMSPEQWRGDPVTPAVDQYALGVLTYALVTGRMPFEAPTPYAMMHKHLNEMPTPPQSWRAGVPDAVKQVLERAMAKQPEERFPTVTAFAQTFAQAISGVAGQPTGFFTAPIGPASLRSAPTPGATPRSVTGGDRSGVQRSRRRAPLWVGLGALLVALVGVGLLFGALQGTPPEATPTGNVEGSEFAAETVESIVVLPTTAPPTETETPTPVPTDTLSPSHTLTLTATATATSSATPTGTPTATLKPEEVAGATYAAIQAATIAALPDTATPDATQTVSAALTALYERDLEQTAIAFSQTQTVIALSWTPTFTPTPTPTATFTPTYTPTPSPTVTLRPTETPTPSPPTATVFVPVIDCFGSPPSRLDVGMQATVLDTEPNSIRVRPQSAEIRGLIPAGAIFNIIGGPQCDTASGLTWWQVEYNGVTGWTAEGKGDVYWIGPAEGGAAAPTSTPAARSGDTPVSLPPCNVILEDDFTGATATGNWYEGETDSSRVLVADGAYEITLKLPREQQGNEPPISWGSLRGFTFRDVRVDAYITASAFDTGEDRTGLWMRYQDENHFLAFMIRSNGSFRIARYILQPGPNNDYTDVVGWTFTDAVHVGDGAGNLLRIDVSGDTFSFYINGEFVASTTDSTWYDGRVAFWGSSREISTFSLDYIRLCEN